MSAHPPPLTQAPLRGRDPSLLEVTSLPSSQSGQRQLDAPAMQKPCGTRISEPHPAACPGRGRREQRKLREGCRQPARLPSLHRFRINTERGGGEAGASVRIRSGQNLETVGMSLLSVAWSAHSRFEGPQPPAGRTPGWTGTTICTHNVRTGRLCPGHPRGPAVPGPRGAVWRAQNLPPPPGSAPHASQSSALIFSF